MTGHQLLSSLNYLCSEAAALGRLVLTGLCISVSASKDRREGRDTDGDAPDSMNTNSCLYLPRAAAAALEGLVRDSLGQINGNKARIIKSDGFDVIF